VADNGPYGDKQAARSAAHHAITPEPGWSILRDPQNRELLHCALSAAGVTTGAYDERTITWLAEWEDAVCQVIAGWVTRAHETGRQPEPGTRTRWAVRYKGRYHDAPGGFHIQPYDDEDMARRAARQVALIYPPEEPQVMYRTIGPWKEAPDV
jgi:hypothetical protein